MRYEADCGCRKSVVGGISLRRGGVFMVNVLRPVLDTKGTHVFCPTENTDPHEEFRSGVLSFLSLTHQKSSRITRRHPPLSALRTIP